MTFPCYRLEMALPIKFIKYLLIGALTNTIAYLAYCLLTNEGMQPKLAMTIVYILGVLCSFLPQKKLAFTYSENKNKSFIPFLLCHLFGFLLNLSLLYFFVDLLKFSHYLVQLFSMVMVAICLFMLFNFVVFKKGDTE